ncbi:MAG: lytic transglycosylase domain-containing protein [Hyphomicrobium sp.]
MNNKKAFYYFLGLLPPLVLLAGLADSETQHGSEALLQNRPSIPSPYNPDASEKEHFARYDKAIAKVLSAEISAQTAEQLRKAIVAYKADDLLKGQEATKALEDPVALKIADWYRLRSGYGSIREYITFLEQNPAWPERSRIKQRLEEAFFENGATSAELMAYFKKGMPENGAGYAALAASYLQDGKTDQAKIYAVKVWREMSLSAKLEKIFLERFGALLSLSDHKARLNCLIIDEIKYPAQRDERADVIRRLIPLLPKSEQQKAEIRLNLFLQKEGASNALDSLLAANEGQDWGLTFHKIQKLRRLKQVDEAARLMLSVPTKQGGIDCSDGWWIERRSLAYAALRIGKPKLAYDLVKDAGSLSVNPKKDQTFMAGWLALRYLKDGDNAKIYFEQMRKVADGPISRAKANYWLGRTAEVDKNDDAARNYYREATRDLDTFHGQLSLLKLDPSQQLFRITPPSQPTEDEIQNFNNLDAVKATLVAHKAKLGDEIPRAFITQLRFYYDSEAQLAMVAHLAEKLGDTQAAVRTAKGAIAQNKNLLYYAYPVHPFPRYTALRKPPETAVLLGIARQETEFNTMTVSGAGAKGLLQVMTVTAQHVCRDYKVKCDIKRLLTDPAYNAMMASAYIADRMDNFSGSYVLTLAAYNAGPGRAREWIKEFGDPRDPSIDPIDWIERIPFKETREYVAKVLSNIQVYRARMGEPEVALRLEKDLNRARLASSRKSFSETPTATKPTQATASDG